MRPTIGRIVHYYRIDDREAKNPHAAIIIKVSPQAISSAENRAAELGASVCALQVFAPFGKITHEPCIPYSESPKAGTWSWPPRVEYVDGKAQG